MILHVSCQERVVNLGEQRPLVSFVIKSAYMPKYLLNLIKSIIRQDYRPLEIIIVSTGNPLIQRIIREVHSFKDSCVSIRTVILNRDPGVAVAQNIGFRVSKGNIVIFVDDDVYLPSDDIVSRVIDVFNKNDDVCIAGVQLRDLENPAIIQATNYLLDKYLFTASVATFTNRVIMDKPHYVPQVSGAFMVVRRKCFDELGGFDNKFFLYVDDIELCLRAWLYGYKVTELPNIIVLHKGGGTVGIGYSKKKLKRISLKRVRFRWRNTLRALLKVYNTKTVTKIVLQYIILSFVEALMYSIINRTAIYIIAFLRSLFWNLQNLTDTLLKRFECQAKRVISDEELFKLLIQYPLIIRIYKQWYYQ